MYNKKLFLSQPYLSGTEEQSLLANTVYLDISRKQSFLEVNPQYERWFKEIRHRLESKGIDWKKLPKGKKEPVVKVTKKETRPLI